MLITCLTRLFDQTNSLFVLKSCRGCSHYFFLNLSMEPTSYNVTLHLAGKAGQIHQISSWDQFVHYPNKVWGAWQWKRISSKQSTRSQYPSCGVYHKHITIVNDESYIINRFLASLTDATRVIIYDCHMFIVQATG